jgi:mono/diheme cytochrome c family protein
VTYAGIRWIAGVVLAGGLSAGSVRLVGADAQEPSRSVNDGVYSAEQAGRGQAVFESKCGDCHEAERFKGSAFLESWIGEPLVSLYDLIGTTMPADNPGTLSPQQYADIIAFMLKMNEYPSGQEELKGSKDAMSAIRIDAVKSH